jgi:hypothetical protein
VREITMKIFIIGFISGFIYRGAVRMFNRWYRKNRKLIKKFIAEYKENNKRSINKKRPVKGAAI